MAGKKTSEKKGNMVKVNLAEIDRKRMEYRWGMESFFRNHEIEADNYKEALERYRESCLIFMSEKDIKKIEDTKKIKVKRIPFINLHKIRREKPLGRWQASAFFKNCKIRENRYENELAAYNQACRLQMKPEEIAVIAEKLKCRESEFAVSDRTVDLSEIRRRLEEKPLKGIFAEWGIEINKDAEETGAQGRYFNVNLKEVRRIEKELDCCKKEFLRSESLGEYTVDLSKVKQRIEENVLKRFFEEYGMNTDEYDQAIAVYEKSGFIKAERADIDKMEKHMKLQKDCFIKNAVDLSDIQHRLKVQEPEDIEQNLKDFGIEIQNYEEGLETYKEASYLTMEEDDIEKLAKSLQCKREEIEIKQNQINLLQIEEKIEKIAREKWSTLKGFFESIGVEVNEYYKEKIENYEKHTMECSQNLFNKLVEKFECKEEDLLFEDNAGECKDTYTVKIVELERRKKTRDGIWKESLYDTLNEKYILNAIDKEESNRIKNAINEFTVACVIDMNEDDCKKISDSGEYETVEIRQGTVTIDLRNIAGFNIDSIDHCPNILKLTRQYKIENSAFNKKIKEAKEKDIHCVNMKLSTANQIAKSSGYELEDLVALAVDVAKDEIKKNLFPFDRKIRMKILCSLLSSEYEQYCRENSRIEYVKTESGYDVTIFFEKEEYEIEDIPKADREDDIVQYLTDALEARLTDEYPDELYYELGELPIVEVEELNYCFDGRFLQILNRIDADGGTLEDKLRVLRNEMPFTQNICDYYEIPNPFDIEE